MSYPRGLNFCWDPNFQLVDMFMKRGGQLIIMFIKLTRGLRGRDAFEVMLGVKICSEERRVAVNCGQKCQGMEICVHVY